MVLVAVIEEMFMLNVTKINEIRNLNLIYVFSTNSIFDNDNKKYGLANVAPTILKLFNIEITNTWQEPVI